MNGIDMRDEWAKMDNDAIGSLEERIATLEAENARLTEELALTKESESYNLRRYKDELATLREQTRWIPVGERLPKDGQMCLIVDDRGDDWKVVKRMKCNLSYSSGWEEVEYDDFAGCEVRPSATHWMPQPEPPQEGEK
jgi:hypothetical protein